MILLYFLVLSTSCCLAAATTTVEDSYDVISGNVTFAVVTEVNAPDSSGSDTCGSYDVNALQPLLAVTWFLDKVNEMNYVPGVKIGLDAYRACSQPDKAASSAITILAKYGVGGKPPNQSSNVLLGMLGPGLTSEVMSVSSLIGQFPANQQVLQISGSATGKDLSDKDQYPNFFRVIPPDNIQVQVILQLIQQLQWNYIAIVYSDDGYGRTAAAELRRLAKEKGICDMVTNANLPTDPKSQNFTNQANLVLQQIKDKVVAGVVVFGGRPTTKEFIRILDKGASLPQLILSEAIALSADTLRDDASSEVRPLAKGSLITSPVHVEFPEFTAFWKELWSNQAVFANYSSRIPWLLAYLEKEGHCDAADPFAHCWQHSASERITIANNDNIYAGYELKGAAVMAWLLKQAHETNCSGQLGLCQNLINYIQRRAGLMSQLRQSTFSLTGFSSVSSAFATMQNLRFSSTQDLILQKGGTEYTVYNFKATPPASNNFSFYQIGSYSGDVLRVQFSDGVFYNEQYQPVDDLSNLPLSQCPDGKNCLQCLRDVSDDVILVNGTGDFYILGLVPISEKNTTNLLSCGPVQPVLSADLAEAVVYAVNYVNTDPTFQTIRVPNNKVGLIVLNTCSNPMRLRQTLMDFFSGKILLPDGTTSARVKDKIIGVVGALYSANSIATADTFTGLEIPSFVQVSPGSTSAELKNRQKYPYFMRLVPPDDAQAKAMLDIAKALGGNYVQVIYDRTTAYAATLYQNILDETVFGGGKYNVCIAQGIPTEPKPDSSGYIFIRDKLRQHPSARIVIVILHPAEVKKVMDAVLPQLSPSDNFLFLGSEAWGRRPELIAGKPLLKGSIVLAQEIAKDLLFEKYFQQLNVTSAQSASVKVNPWLAAWFEVRGNCYLDKSFMRANGRRRCPDNVALTYIQDTMAAVSVQSTFALARGFFSAHTKKCGKSSLTKCTELKSEDIVAEMKQVKLDLYNNNHLDFVFDSNGDGLVAFKLLRVSRNDETPDDNDLTFEDIGQWSPLNGLKLTGNIMPPTVDTFTSVCPNEQECTRCFTPRANGGQFMPSTDGGDKDTTSSGAIIGVATASAIIIIVLIVVIVVIVVRQRRQSRRRPLSYPSNFGAVSADPYLEMSSSVGSQYGGGNSRPLQEQFDRNIGSPANQNRYIMGDPIGQKDMQEGYASCDDMSGGSYVHPSSSGGSYVSSMAPPAHCGKKLEPGYLTVIQAHEKGPSA